MQTNGDTSSTGRATGRATTHRLGQRHTIPEAAALLGLTEEAVRQRVKRGTLDSMKVGGNLFVLLDGEAADGSADHEKPVDDGPYDRSYDGSNNPSRLVERMASEIDHLRNQLEEAHAANRENRRIIAGLVQRVPELEAHPEPRDAPETASEGPGKGPVGSMHETGKSRRSWLRRLFFGPE